MDLVRSLRHLPLPMPKDLKQIFQLLGLYDSQEGLEGLLGRIDATSIRPRDVYTAVLQRAPDDVATATPGEGYDGRRHLRAALESPEFQSRSMKNFLHVFPHKVRRMFVHIPKCAGTDLVLNLAPSRLSFPKVLTLEQWVSKSDLFAALSGLVRAEPFFDEIFLYGHVTVGDYVDIAGVRSDDHMFTVVRDPSSLLLSQANYAVGRLRQDPAISAPDTIEIATWLELSKLRESPTPDYWKELAIKCLGDRRICGPNRICHYLGKAQIATYEQAISHIVMYDIEVTDANHYSRWLDERWDIKTGTRHNESEKFLTIDEARQSFPDMIHSATAEDQKLYDVIQWLLRKTGRASICGSEIAEIAGAEGILALPELLAREKAAGQATISVFPVRKLNEQIKDVAPRNFDDPNITVISEYLLCQGGNGGEITRAGWAFPETKFTWTNGNQSIIELPCPGEASDYVLRICGSPLVVNDILPSQRLVVSVNGIEVGAVEARELAMLDCRLPWAILRGLERIVATLSLPDAAKPSALGRGEDSRLLGFAVQSVILAKATVAEKPAPVPEVEERPLPPPVPDNLQELALMFESIGENCEFGLVQRRWGAEPLGLFRFSSTPLPKLVKGLRSKFKGLGKASNIEIQESGNGREYMVLDKAFGFLFHAWVLVGEQQPEEIAIRETRRLPLLVRKLLEEVALGQKLFVYHGMSPLSLEEVRTLTEALRAYGPATLLWCELADETHPPGTVERIELGLMKGYMDRFAPGENAHDLSLDCWTTLCKNALQVWRSE